MSVCLCHVTYWHKLKAILHLLAGAYCQSSHLFYLNLSLSNYFPLAIRSVVPKVGSTEPLRGCGKTRRKKNCLDTASIMHRSLTGLPHKAKQRMKHHRICFQTNFFPNQKLENMTMHMLPSASPAQRRCRGRSPWLNLFPLHWEQRWAVQIMAEQ